MLLKDKDHVIPTHTTAVDRDLLRVATEGAVKLFNAIATYQHTNDSQNDSSYDDSRKKPKKLKHGDTFLETLNSQGTEPSRPSWAAFDSDLTSSTARLKDWENNAPKSDARSKKGGRTDRPLAVIEEMKEEEMEGDEEWEQLEEYD